ncbi:MAG: 16S rRNA (adenine(1518)-N(6)/adenine(1519)-N(6))-dimethyltransferase RsmA [Clostridia bacterium]|nr:16S rRNA (adenine(1518)-N(6)/adenine(1519)-N(6))-dimethyltransferase RsmA [Clostridia bacterium]
MMDNEIYALLKVHGFTFKKRLGQNFITDRSLLDSIVSLAGVTEEDTVLEIGCGAGTLTRALAAKARKVITYEVDRSLEPIIRVTLMPYTNVQVIYQDFLKADMAALEEGLDSYKVVANLPYYLTTPLICKVVEESQKCSSITVMVQNEMADRLCGAAGTAEYGAITANIALRATVEKMRFVPRTVFYPMPDVDSAVIRITMQDGRIPVKDKEMYKRAVRAAFLSRRKTYANNLMAVFNLSRETAEDLVQSVCGNAKARGETFSPEMFAAMADRLSAIL